MSAHSCFPFIDGHQIGGIKKRVSSWRAERSGAAMAWNVFKFCTALRGLGSVMIFLVLGVVGVTYYALVVVNYGPSLFHGDLDLLIALAVLLLFHSLVKLLFSVTVFPFWCCILSWLALILFGSMFFPFLFVLCWREKRGRGRIF